MGNTFPKNYSNEILPLVDQLDISPMANTKRTIEGLKTYQSIQSRLKEGSDKNIQHVQSLLINSSENPDRFLTDEQLVDSKFSDAIIKNVQAWIVRNQYNHYGTDWSVEDVINMRVPKVLRDKINWKKIVIDATVKRIKNQFSVDVGGQGANLYPQVLRTMSTLHPDYLTPELMQAVAKKAPKQIVLDNEIRTDDLLAMMEFHDDIISEPGFQQAWQQRVLDTVQGRGYQGAMNEFVDKLIPRMASTDFDKMFESKEAKDMFIKQLLMGIPHSDATVTYNKETLPLLEEFIQKYKDDPVFIERVMPSYYNSTHRVADSNSFQSFGGDATAVAKKAWLQTLSTIFVPPQVISGQHLSYLINVIKKIPAMLLTDTGIRNRVIQILRPVDSAWLNTGPGQFAMELDRVEPAHRQLIIEAIGS